MTRKSQYSPALFVLSTCENINKTLNKHPTITLQRNVVKILLSFIKLKHALGLPTLRAKYCIQQWSRHFYQSLLSVSLFRHSTGQYSLCVDQLNFNSVQSALGSFEMNL